MFNAGIKALTSHLIQHCSLCYGLNIRLAPTSFPSPTALPSTPTLSAGCLTFPSVFMAHVSIILSPHLRPFPSSSRYLSRLMLTHYFFYSFETESRDAATQALRASCLLSAGFAEELYHASSPITPRTETLARTLGHQVPNTPYPTNLWRFLR